MMAVIEPGGSCGGSAQARISTRAAATVERGPTSGFLHRFGDGREHRPVEMCCAGLLRVDAANNLGPVFDCLLRMETARRSTPPASAPALQACCSEGTYVPCFPVKPGSPSQRYGAKRERERENWKPSGWPTLVYDLGVGIYEQVLGGGGIAGGGGGGIAAGPAEQTAGTAGRRRKALEGEHGQGGAVFRRMTMWGSKRLSVG